MGKWLFPFIVGAALTALYYRQHYQQKEGNRRMNEFEAAIAALKEKVEAEKAEVLAAIEELKGQVSSGLPKAQVLAALDGLTGSVEGIFTPTTPPVDDPDA